jgi:hypothetical protein
MANRLPKTLLLQEIRAEPGRLDARLQQLTPRQMTKRGATLAGWSVKDILAHLDRLATNEPYLVFCQPAWPDT